jgi:hypothetical protein
MADTARFKHCLPKLQINSIEKKSNKKKNNDNKNKKNDNTRVIKKYVDFLCHN